MNYTEAEKVVFDQLWNKHEQDPSFTFSVRKKASKGAEADYFIGTKASNYFGFTCWHVPIYYPGASTDFCSFIVRPKDDGFEYNFQVFTPNAEEVLESEPVLKVCHYLAQQITAQFTAREITYSQTADTTAMLWIGVNPKPSEVPISFIGNEVVQEQFMQFIDMILPAVDAGIEATKKQFPEFPGKRIDQAQFQLIIDKMKIRQERHSSSSNPVETVTPSEINLLPISTSLPIDLAILPSKNLLLYGPPGTGKTHYLQNNLLEYFKEGNTKRYTFITFHQAFSYEDFIEGLKPETDEASDGKIRYRVQPGIFYTVCDEAAKLAGFDSLTHSLTVSQEEREERFSSAPPYALFIDEINRANVSATFGELITLLESNKRLGSIQEIADVVLPYSKKPFGVPANLYLIGTMNTADRSVEALDTALRRRFLFREMAPDASLLKQVIENVPISQLMETINLRLERLLSRDQQIGHAFFLSMQTEDDLINVFNYSIIPLLQEYFYGDYRKIGLVLGKAFVNRSTNEIKFADFDDDLAAEYDEVSLWAIKPATMEAIQAILP